MTNRRNPVRVETALSKQAIDAASQRYLGSLIACEQHPSWFAHRTLYEITDQSIPDPLARNIFNTIAEASSIEEDFDYSPQAIAYRMVENDSVGKVDDINGAIFALAARLEEIASFGETTLKGFKRVESLFAEKLKFDRAQHVAAHVGEIMSAKNGRSMSDKVEEARKFLEELSGQFVPQTRSANAERQAEILDEMQADVEARKGQVDLTFPPHFGVFSKPEILRPRRKQLVTISGPSGAGKSIIAHLFAEWLMRCGYRVLFILTEDDLETTLARATARHIPGTTFFEVDEGDPRGKKDKYKKLLAQWKDNGGEIVYEEQPGISGTELRTLIESRLTEAKAQNQPFAAVFVDYFQDIAFHLDAVGYGNNIVAAAGQCAVQLRAIAQKYDVVMCVASQETKDGDTIKTAWSQRLTQKSQIWLRFDVATAKEEKTVWIKSFSKDANERNEVERTIAQAGEQLPFIYLVCEKANRGAKGRREVLLRIGQQQKVWAIEFYKRLRQNRELEWQVPVFQPITENFFAIQDEMFAKHDAAVDQLDPWQYDPIRKNGH